MIKYLFYIIFFLFSVKLNAQELKKDESRNNESYSGNLSKTHSQPIEIKPLQDVLLEEDLDRSRYDAEHKGQEKTEEQILRDKEAHDKIIRKQKIKENLKEEFTPKN